MAKLQYVPAPISKTLSTSHGDLVFVDGFTEVSDAVADELVVIFPGLLVKVAASPKAVNDQITDSVTQKPAPVVAPAQVQKKK